MKIKEVMSRSCTTVTPQTTLAEAAKIMSDQDIGFIPVVENDKIIGMITDRDIVCRAVSTGCAPTAAIESFISKKTYYCYDDQEAEEVCANMADIKVRRLPVVNRQKRLVGVVSIGDLAQDVNKITVGQAVQSITNPANDAKAA